MPVVDCSCIAVNAGQLQNVVAVFAGGVGNLDFDMWAVFEFVGFERWAAVPEETGSGQLLIAGDDCDGEHFESHLKQSFVHVKFKPIISFQYFYSHLHSNHTLSDYHTLLDKKSMR